MNGRHRKELLTMVRWINRCLRRHANRRTLMSDPVWWRGMLNFYQRLAGPAVGQLRIPRSIRRITRSK